VLLAGLLVVVVVAGVAFSLRDTLMALVTGSQRLGGAPAVAQLTLPPGFRATLYADGLSGPRFLAIAPDGTLFTTERAAGDIVALRDPTHTGRATQRIVVASGLSDPTSVVYVAGALYGGEAAQITRLTLGPDLRAVARQVVISNLPAGGQHATRTVLVGPDGALYLSDDKAGAIYRIVYAG
jgi:glucose/arabinose dehydrogenase